MTVDIYDQSEGKSQSLLEAYEKVKSTLAATFPSADIGLGLVAADSRPDADFDDIAVTVNAKWEL